MPEDEPEVGDAEDRRGSHELSLLESEELRSDKTGHVHPARDADDNHDRRYPGFHYGYDGKYQEESREGEHDVDEPHDEGIRLAPVEACQRAEEGPDAYGNAHCHEADLERDPASPDH